MPYPARLQAVLDTFAMFPDSADRSTLLLSYADKFHEVSPEIAARPFDSTHLVPHCESEAYVWAVPNPDGTLRLAFAVENPSGISAKALAAILDQTLSGLHAQDIARIDTDIVEQIFRRNISMGKGMGLMSMVQAVRALAKAASRQVPPAGSPTSRTL
jgi:cysteine desulfuration protein SufE